MALTVIFAWLSVLCFAHWMFDRPAQVTTVEYSGKRLIAGEDGYWYAVDVDGRLVKVVLTGLGTPMVPFQWELPEPRDRPLDWFRVQGPLSPSAPSEKKEP